MAKLVTTKEKYGVSVATRIDPMLAQKISDQATQLGLTFAKMLGLIIAKGASTESHKPLSDDERRLIADKYKQTIGLFISRVANDEEHQRELSEIFNECYNG